MNRSRITNFIAVAFTALLLEGVSIMVLHQAIVYAA